MQAAEDTNWDVELVVVTRRGQLVTAAITMASKVQKEVSSYLFIEDTLGTVSLSQIPSASSLSLISHANIVGFCLLYSAILSTTFGVATLGLDPPITPGLMLPVS